MVAIKVGEIAHIRLRSPDLVSGAISDRLWHVQTGALREEALHQQLQWAKSLKNTSSDTYAHEGQDDYGPGN